MGRANEPPYEFQNLRATFYPAEEVDTTATLRVSGYGNGGIAFIEVTFSDGGMARVTMTPDDFDMIAARMTATAAWLRERG